MKRFAVLLAALVFPSTAHAGLVAYYAFEGAGPARFADPAGDFADNLVGQYNPAFSSDVSPLALGSTQSASFDGNSALFTDAYTTDLAPDADALTIMFWVKGEDILQENNNTRLITSRVRPDGSATTGRSWQVEGFGNNGSNGDAMDVRYQPTNGVYPANWFSPDAINALARQDQGETAEWHHVAFVLANSGSPIDGGAYGQTFVDGVQVGSVSNPDPLWDGHTMANLEGQLIIGGSAENAGTRAFTGLLDDVAIFSGAVDATTINQIATGAISPADLLPTGPPATLTYNSTDLVSLNHSVVDVSVFPGKASYDGNGNSGVFGDGTVEDYRFFNNSGTTFNGTGYADGNAGLVSPATATNSSGLNGGPLDWGDVWTTNDPGVGFSGPANFTTDTFARSQGVTGTVDISSFNSGSLYFIHGTYFDTETVDLAMTGPGQPDLTAQYSFNPPNDTNRGYITSFDFANADLYNSISWTYTNADTDASRARFMGVILDGVTAGGGPVLLIDDHFDNNDLATDVNGVNGGFVLVSNGGSGGSASEAGTLASLTTSGSSTDNSGIVSINAFDGASLGTHGFEMYFNIDGLTAGPGTNGMFLGLQDDGTTFYRSIDNFGLVFFGNESRTSSGAGFGMIYNDIGNPGAAGNGAIFDHGDLQRSSVQDGFEAWITADATGWSYRITGVNDTGGTPTEFSNSGTWVAAGLAPDFFDTFFDATEHVAVYTQRSSGTGNITTTIDQITVTDLTPAGPSGLVWNGSDNDWGTANWDGSPPTFPAATDDATINDGQVTVEANHAVQSLAFNGGTLILGAGNTLTIGQPFNTDPSSAITFQAGSDLVVTGGLLEGVLNDAGAPATVTFTGPGTLELTNPANNIDNLNFDSNDGMLKVYYASLGNADVNLDNSTLHIEGEAGMFAIPALSHYGYHVNSDAATLDLDGNGGMMNGGSPETFGNFEGHGLLTVGPGDRGLDFNNDADFRAVPASILDDASGDGWVIDRNDNYSNMWLGVFVPDVSGTWEFRNAGDDDRAGIWLDLDQDGIFESSTPGLGDNRGEQLSWENGGWKSASLTAGQEYMIAFTHREGGGGSRADFRFRGPSGSSVTSETIVKPYDPAQAGMWLTDAPGLGVISQPGTNITVESDSALEAVTSFTATFGSLTFDPAGGSAVLTVSDAVQGVTFADTSFASPGTGGINAQVNVNMTGTGNLAGNGHAFTFTKSGPGDMLVTGTGTGLGNTTLSVQEGRVIGVASGGGGPFGTATLELDGGALILSSAGGNQTFDSGLIVQQVSVLTAGAAGGGLAGPLTVTVGGPTTLNADMLVSNQDSYNLSLDGPVSGPGGITSGAGALALGGAGPHTYAGPTLIQGGSLAVNALTNGTAALSVNNADATISAPLVTTGGPLNALDLSGYRWYGRSDSFLDFEGNGGLLGETPLHTIRHAGQIDLAGDAAFRALIPQITGNDDYQTVWTGFFNAQTTGDHQFRTPQSDDRATMWIDLDQDGVFERQGDAGDEQVSWEGSTGTRPLIAGQSYAVAFGHIEHGGGSTFQAQWHGPTGDAFEAWTTVQPEVQVGYFTTAGESLVEINNGTLTIAPGGSVTTGLFAVRGGGTAVGNGPVTAADITIAATGVYDANIPDAFPGANVAVSGLLNANADGATRGSSVTINPCGTVDINTLQSAAANFGEIIVGPKGILTGNLTNVTYGPGGAVQLQPGAIVAPTAGPSPTLVDTGGAAILYEPIANVGSGATYNWGDVSGTPFMGGVFKPDWTPGGDFVSTVNDMSSTNTGLEFLMMQDNVRMTSTTVLNTTNTTRGAEFIGAGQVELAAPWSGTATVLTRTGNFDDRMDPLVECDLNTTNDWILRINSNSSNGALGDGQTANVSNGRVSYRNVNSLAAGATLNINENGTLYMNDSADGRRPARGTLNINPNGLIWMNNDNRLTNGATINIHPDAYVMLDYESNVNTADPNADPGTDGVWGTPDDVAAGFDNVNIIISDDQFRDGLYLGAGRRLTTGYGQGIGTNATTTTIYKSVSADPTGDHVIFSNAFMNGDLDINSQVLLDGVDILVNDPLGVEISLPRQDGNVTRALVPSNGRVNFDGSLTAFHNMDVRNGYVRLGDGNNDDIQSTGSLTVRDGAIVEVRGDLAGPILDKWTAGTLFPGGIFVDKGGELRAFYDRDNGNTEIPGPITFRGTGDVPGMGKIMSILRPDENGGTGADGVRFPNLIFEEGARVGIDRQDQGKGELFMEITLAGSAWIEREPDDFNLWSIDGTPGPHTLKIGNPGDALSLTNQFDQRFDVDINGNVGETNPVILEALHVRLDFEQGSQVYPGSVVRSRGPETTSGQDDERIDIHAGRDGTGGILGGLFELSGNDRMNVRVEDRASGNPPYVNQFSGTVRILDDGALGTNDGRLRSQRVGGNDSVDGDVEVYRLEVGPGARAVLQRADGTDLNILNIALEGTGSRLETNGVPLQVDTFGGVGRIFEGSLGINDGGTLFVGAGEDGLMIDSPLTLGTDVTFAYSIDGPSPGVYFDQLVYTGANSLDLLDSWLNADIVPYGAIQVGDEVTILTVDGGTVSGLFRDPLTGDPISEGGSFFVGTGDQPNVTWSIHYDYAGGEVLLTALQIIPEPATATLFGLSLLALARRRRRK